MIEMRALRLAVLGVVISALGALWMQPSYAANDRSEPRDVADFSRIDVDGAFTTDVHAGQRSRLVVTADSAVIDRITTEVRAGTLYIGMQKGANVFLHTSPKISIALPALRSFANEGAGATTLTGLAGGDVSIANAGAASIVASGRAAHETISLQGAGRIDASAVDAHDVTVDNDGVGSVHVRASGSLTMTMNGVGEIRYAGNPVKIDKQVNGIGRISPL